MPTLQSANILIVEDETIVAWNIQEALERLGYQVQGRVASGTDALQLAAKTQPDLVLMDIEIEGDLNGIDTAERLYRSFQVPIVYLTAHSDDEILHQAAQTHSFGYLLKPFEPRELHGTIQIALQRHQQQCHDRAIQQWFSSTLNSLGDATIAIAPDGSVIFMNAIAEQLTGWNHHEALGTPIDQVLPLVLEPTLEVLENGMQAIRLNQPIPLPESCLLRARNGVELLVEGTATPITDPMGNGMGGVIVLRDATEHQVTYRQLEQKNRQLEQFQLRLISQLQEQTSQVDQVFACLQILTQLLNQSGAVNGEADRIQLVLEQLATAIDTEYAWIALYDDHRIVASLTHEWINGDRLDCQTRRSAIDAQIDLSAFSAFYQPLFLGASWIFPPSDILPTPYQAFLQFGNQVLVCPLLSALGFSLGREEIVGEIGLITTGKPPWSQLQATVISQIASCAVRTVEQANQTASQQIQHIDLERLNYLKEDFISSVSHELKNPLINMQMAMERLQELVRSLKPVLAARSDLLPVSDPLQQNLEQSLQILQEEWQREYGMVNDLLNFQAPTIPLDPLDFSLIDLREWLPLILQRFAPQTKKLRQTLSYHLADGDLLLQSHCPSLERIMVELLHNACKFTPAGQQISLSAGMAANRFRLSVSNTGIEIPAAELQPIFQPFYRLARPYCTDYCGTGLGLALVKKLVSRLGGTIEAESSHGSTTFMLELPV